MTHTDDMSLWCCVGFRNGFFVRCCVWPLNGLGFRCGCLLQNRLRYRIRAQSNNREKSRKKDELELTWAATTNTKGALAPHKLAN